MFVAYQYFSIRYDALHSTPLQKRKLSFSISTFIQWRWRWKGQERGSDPQISGKRQDITITINKSLRSCSTESNYVDVVQLIFINLHNFNYNISKYLHFNPKERHQKVILSIKYFKLRFLYNKWQISSC